MTKILMIEDEEYNRDMQSRRLADKGYHVVMAEDGESAVDMARTELPDLILMDVGLPGIDGYETTRRIKSQQETRAIPIIALTACAMSGDRDKALAAGCNDYDSKPVDFTRLISKIEALLKGKPDV
jgi:two-component system cell cycle response regulator DivK